jgi:DNA-binding transcriptional ArsR family regulator
MPRRARRLVTRRHVQTPPSNGKSSTRPAGARLDQDAARSVRLFRALGHSTRARVVLALAAAEMCVGDLAARLRTTSSVISHQLRLLRDLGLVKCRRTGRQAHYSLRQDALQRLFEDSLARLGAGHKGKRRV